jgi:hypothetical protein
VTTFVKRLTTSTDCAEPLMEPVGGWTPEAMFDWIVSRMPDWAAAAAARKCHAQDTLRSDGPEA